jgi:methylaspartate mutase sigma subunit
MLPQGVHPRPSRAFCTIVASTPSDAHSWNLVYLQLVLEEYTDAVVNLGPCLPTALLVEESRRRRPDLVVVSSVNGHGHADGLAIIAALRAEPALDGVRVVIGGMLSTDPARDPVVEAELRAAGYDEVYVGPDAVPRLRSDLARWTSPGLDAHAA